MNTIAQRIADFLKNHPPFNILDFQDILAISKRIDVLYVEPKTFVFNINEPIANAFYVVKEGGIGLYRTNNQLVDQCDEGDIFGLRALMRDGLYKLSAQALEECVLYRISSDILEKYITSNSEANRVLLKMFASNTLISTKETWDTIPKDALTPILDFTEEQSANFSKNPIQCIANTSIQEAAKLMTLHRVGSIIITENKKPIGIITDKDLRSKIATGETKITESVKIIMSSPVKTFPENISISEAQIAMLTYKITHLCITKDGSPNSELTGILSEHDIVVIRENNASGLVKEIKRTNSIEQLASIKLRSEKLLERYMQQKLPISFIAKIISAINTALTDQAITFVLQTLESTPPVTFSWLAIGSQGRHEQLLRTDQDNCLVFENVAAKDYQATQSYFLNFAQKVNDALHTIGFEYCPANMMANNPKWCLSVSEWQKQFTNWISTPDPDNLMLCTIFFDFDLVYGNKKLVNELTEIIFKAIKSHDIFLNHLGVNALKNPPPLSFFRNFLVENSGEHQDQFDIKARAMMPLVDAARLLILSKNEAGFNNTIARYERLITLEPQNKDVYDACLNSFKDLLFFRTHQGLTNNDSGRFINLQALSKADRLDLKQTFRAVKAVQELIQTRYQLAQFL
tara:strand:+ start:9459 stop:11354 length:1896 start_codon:yes stop_codon:yes gene_type:complete